MRTMWRLIAFVWAWGFLAQAAVGDQARLAYFDTELSRKGPGLLLRDILRGDDPQVQAVLALVDRAGADLIVLSGIDYDAEARAAHALNAALNTPYPHVVVPRPNSGVPTGLDLDGNGRLGEARDAQGYGRFSGAGGMVILSRLELAGQAHDFSDLLWAEAPDTAMLPSDRGRAVQRLSSVVHVIQPVRLGGTSVNIGIFRATTPVFDGPEDRNGRRNRDEVLFWKHVLDQEIAPVPPGPLIVMGGANLDPDKGEGHREAIDTLLRDDRLHDAAPGHRDDFTARPGNATMTVDWNDPVPGDMRVDYILPSSELGTLDSGVLWPGPDAPLATTVQAASRHRLIWVDLRAVPDQ